MGSSAGKSSSSGISDSKKSIAQDKKDTQHPASHPISNGNTERKSPSEDITVSKKTENGGSVTNTRHDRPKTSRERVNMGREKTIVPKEKPPKLRHEKTGMMKREKTMGLTRQKTMINDKVFKGKKKLAKTVSNADLASGSQTSSVNAILMGSLTGDLPSTSKIVRIFTSSTFKDTEK